MLLPLAECRVKTVVMALIGLLGVACSALTACSDTSAPNAAPRELLFAVGGEGNSIFVIDPVAGEVIARPGPLPLDKGQPVLSPDSATLFFVADDQSGAGIYALDTRTLRAPLWLDLGTPSARPVHDGVWFSGGLMAMVPSEPALYLTAYSAPAQSDPPLDDGRIALVDTGTQRVTTTIGPLDDITGSAFLPPGAVAPDGALLVVGSRLRSQRPSLSWLFVIDPATHAIIDSAAVNAPNPAGGATLRGVVASPDGRHVYLAGADATLYGYDLVEHRIVGSAPLDGGSLTISPDGQRLYAVNPGMPVIFIPPSDSVQVFDATTITPLPSINLAGNPAFGSGPQVMSIRVSRDGKWLYLASGGPHLSGQPLRVVVMDRATDSVVHVIQLGDYGNVALVVGR